MELEVLCHLCGKANVPPGSIADYRVVEDGQFFRWGRKEKPPWYFCLHVNGANAQKIRWIRQSIHFHERSSVLDAEGIPITLAYYASRIMVRIEALPPLVRGQIETYQVVPIDVADFNAALFCPKENRLLTSTEANGLWSAGTLDGLSSLHS